MAYSIIIGMNNLLKTKDDPRIPDKWGIKITYFDGKTEDFEIIGHAYHGIVFSFTTSDDTWHDRPVDKIFKVDYDKRFSTYIALKAEEAKKQA